MIIWECEIEKKFEETMTKITNELKDAYWINNKVLVKE